MKKYTALFKMRFLHGLQYRVAALAGMSTQFAWGSMTILMYSAFYRSNPASFPMDFSALSSYVWLQQGFLALFMLWFLENEIFDMITSGNVAYELTRPIDLYSLWMMRSLCSRASKAILRCVPLFLFALCLPAPYRLMLPASFEVFILFAVSMLLACLNVCAFCMLIYISTFFTLSATGIRMLAVTVVEFLSGAVVPLPFLPQPVQQIFSLLPFASMQNAPLRIYSQDILPSQALSTIALQLFWVIVLIALGKFLMKKALKTVVVQGG